MNNVSRCWISALMLKSSRVRRVCDGIANLFKVKRMLEDDPMDVTRTG